MRVLLIEDEVEMAAALRTALERHGVVVDRVGSFADGEEAARVSDHDIALLDLNLPDGDGLDLIPVLRRRNPGTPVIVMTARGDISDRVAGLDQGADDYLPKPFALEELLARMRAVRRRPAGLTAEKIELGRLSYDMIHHEAWVGSDRLDLPRRELSVIAALMRRCGRTVMRGALDEAVYGFSNVIQSNSLDAHVSRLRRRLAAADAGVEIHAVRGVGYLIRATP